MTASPAPAAMPQAAPPNSTRRWIPRSSCRPRALAQIEVLNQQISALRRQLAALEEALEASEKRDKESQGAHRRSRPAPQRRARAARAGTVALSFRILRHACAPFSATAPTFASSATASCSSPKYSSMSAKRLLLPEGRAELDKVATRADRTRQANPGGNRLGDARRRPHRRRGRSSTARCSSRTGNCRRRVRSRWCNI